MTKKANFHIKQNGLHNKESLHFYQIITNSLKNFKKEKHYYNFRKSIQKNHCA